MHNIAGIKGEYVSIQQYLFVVSQHVVLINLSFIYLLTEIVFFTDIHMFQSIVFDFVSINFVRKCQQNALSFGMLVKILDF